MAFIAGARYGSASELELHQGRQMAQGRLNTLIAVVNADTGMEIDGVWYNYAAAIIDTLGHDFILVSPAMAQTGFANGTYGAVITFPPDVSYRVLSFNAVQAERVRLEFHINDNLPERDYLEVFMTIVSLQQSINTTLANTYVSSIIRQFHEAQDQVDGIFQNNLADLMALDIITLRNFADSLDLEEVPLLPFEPAGLDRRFYMEQVADFASDVAGWYLNSFEMASDQYLWMREGLFALTEYFPEQEEEWIYMLTLWTRYSEEYGELLEIYSAYIRAHDDALEAWHYANMAWNESLTDYQYRIRDWHQDSTLWFDEAEEWHSDYMEYLDLVREYMEELTAHRIELENSLTPVMDDISSWLNYLENFEQNLYAIYESLKDTVETYNFQSEVANVFLRALINWHSGLDEHQLSVTDWVEIVNYRVTDLTGWQSELDEVQNDLLFIFELFWENVYALPPMPDEVYYDIYLSDYWHDRLEAPEEIQEMPEFVLSSWLVGDFSRPPTTPPNPYIIIPDYVGMPDPFFAVASTSGRALTAFSANFELEYVLLALNNWYYQLVDVAEQMRIWYEDAQYSLDEISYWEDELINFYYDLTDFYWELGYSRYDMLEWRYNLDKFFYVIFGWDSDLREYSGEMYIWRSFLEDFLEELYEVEIPDLPYFVERDYLEIPYEDERPIPDSIEPLEMVELPTWDETLLAPTAYDGAEIAEAFTRDFPLDGNAVAEPMGIERMMEFTDYYVPEIVGEHVFLTTEQPDNPLVGPPPRPDGFWSSLSDMHGQLSGFEISDFLSYDIHSQVERSLQYYEMFLASIGDDIEFMFEDNIWLMHDIHAEYNFFLDGLRADAFAANFAEQISLQESIEEFAAIVGGSGENTRDRLGSFAVMMPESRTAGGINQSLVNFVSAPFEFTSVSMRDEVPVFADNLFIEPVAETYQRHQNIVFIIAGVVFVITFASSAVSYLRDRRKRTAEKL